MSVLIAKNIGECSRWTGVAVVVDVLRSSTTMCALLRKGARTVVVCPDGQTAAALVPLNKKFTVMSELNIALAHRDDSPFLAGKLPSGQPVLLVADETGRALVALSQASLVLLGGFCNFKAVARLLAAQQQDILLVPATVLSGREDEEDMLCVQAFKEVLQGTGTPEQFLVQMENTLRLGEWSRQCPATAQEDVNVALRLDVFSVVPQAVRAKTPNSVVCFACGREPDPAWATFTKPARPAQEKLSGGLRGFFSGLIRSVKEDLTDAQNALQQPAGNAPAQHNAAASAPAPSEEAPAASLKKHESDEVVLSGDTTFIKIPGGAVPEDLATQRLSIDISGGENVPAMHVATDPVRPRKQATPAPAAQEELVLQTPAVQPEQARPKKAVVLFSGGLDSTTCLYWALAQGYVCEALTVSYGQRHLREVVSAQAIARKLGVKHHLIDLNLPWLSSSSLVDEKQPLPDIAVEKIPQAGIPSTYVPGRNLMFLSIAGSLLDVIGADAIVAGPNAIDFSGYPDCTPAFFKAAGEALNRGTRRGVREGIEVLAPLMHMSKVQIVQLAAKLHVPFELTWSCYAGGEKPCGKCDSCKLRAKGFEEAGVHDTSLD